MAARRDRHVVDAGGRHRAAFAVLLVSAMVIAGCAAPSGEGSSTSADDSEIDPDGIVRIAHNFDATVPFYFDPATNFGTTMRWLTAVYGGLLNRVGPNEVEPGLAESVEVLDARTVQINLRSGLTFTDGTPLDAEAVKFSLERTAARGSAAAIREPVRTTLDHVEVVDPLTAVIHSSADNAGLWMEILPDPDASIYSPTAAREADAADADVGLGKAPVGAGPFKITRWTDQGVELEKNPDYWDADNVRIGGIEFVHVTPASCVTALQTAEVDFVLGGAKCISREQVDLFLNDSSFEVDSRPWDGFTVLLLNKTNPPLNNREFRLALNYAIDREALFQTLWRGDGNPETTLFPPGSPQYNNDPEKVISYDPDRARQLLEESGVGPNPAFQISGGPAGTENTRILEVLQAQLREFGVDMQIVPTANSTIELLEGRIEASVNGFNNPGPFRIGFCCLAHSVGNSSDGFSMPNVDRLFNELAALEDLASPEALQLYADIQREIIVNEVWGIWIGSPPVYTVWNADRVVTAPLTTSLQTEPLPYLAGFTVRR